MMQRLSRSLLCLWLSAWLVWLNIPSAQAQQSLYYIEGVKAQATAANGTDARAKAIEKAEQDAFQTLMQRLVEANMLAAPLQGLKPHQISSLVSSYEVQNEKIGPKSYEAALSIMFDANMLGQVANVAPMPASVGTATDPNAAYPLNPNGANPNVRITKLLVVPALRTQSGILLWDSTSPWYQAWQRKQGAMFGQFQVLVPQADQQDNVLFPLPQLQQKDPQALRQLATRYQADDVLIADAALVKRANSRIALKIKLSRMADLSQQHSVEAEAIDIADALFQMGADRILQSLPAQVPPTLATAAPTLQNLSNQPLPYNTPTPSATVSRIKILTPLQSMREWANIRRKLEQLPMVQSVQVSAMTTRQADAYLHFSGSMTELATALQSEGYQVQRQNSYWVLMPQ